MSKSRTLLIAGITIICLISVVSLHAQTAPTAIQLFGPVFVNNSIQLGQYDVGANTVNLSCPASPSAIISSSKNGLGKVFQDNLLFVNGANVCKGGDPNSPGSATATNCFQLPYESAAGNFVGQNPDTASSAAVGVTAGNFIPTYGVDPIDVSTLLVPGSQNVKFELIDVGLSNGNGGVSGLLGSSTLYLVTNCTQNGVQSGGSITGNPITPTTLKQDFPFDNTTGQLLIFTADFSKAFADGNLSTLNNPVPTVTDHAISQTDFATLVAGTSFGPAVCVPHTGELDAAGHPTCKMYTITCTTSTSPTPSGANCPSSTARDLYFQDKFDTTPSLVESLPAGTGFGFLMGSDGWTGPSQPCSFGGLLSGQICPQNTATAFLGDYAYGGTPKSLNSTFVGVSGVPLPSTAVTVSPQTSYGWTNSTTPLISFVSSPATFTGANANGFVAAPITSLTYGIQPAANPVPDTTFPVPGDTTNANPAPCPAVPTPGAVPFSSTATPTLADGQYTLHYFATDCAGTEELQFTVQPTNLGNWASFNTKSIKVDTSNPTASFTSTVPTNVLLNQTVNVPFTCTDTGSGLAICGTVAGQALGSTQLGTSPVNGSVALATSTPGSKTISLYGQDLAGNSAPGTSANYTVGYATSGLCDGDAGHQILQPVNADGTSVFKQGRSVPAKFRVCDANGNSIGTAGVVQSVTVQSTTGTISTTNEDVSDTLDDSVFRWDPTGQLWIRNISTKNLMANKTYIYTVTLNDNSTIVFRFGLR